MPSLDDLDVDNRRVFVRVDFNVPLNDAGEITDDTRIRAALPTLRELRKRGARMVLASHLGRPKGKIDPRYSMEPVAARLAELMECEVRLPDEVVGDGVTKLVNDTRAGQIVLLENLRFDAGETKNDPDFTRALAKLADAYVNDAFGVSHRSHASVVGVPGLLREHAPGRLLERELQALSRVVESPSRPFVAVVGGAKVSDKLGILIALTERLAAGDSLLIGGAMANTFLAANDRELGSSLLETDQFRSCKRILDKAAARDVRIFLPTDLRTGLSLDSDRALTRPVEEGLLEKELALDIGPLTERRYASVIASAKTVLWNGPMGVFENPTFAQGTLAVAQAVATCPGYTVVGGGDSVAAVNQMELGNQIDHISTGGGASLSLIEGEELPGIAALAADRGES